MREIFDRGLNVADTIEELDKLSWSAADLAWVIANKKGNVKKWAEKEIKTAKDAPPN
jgi:hypothetical protein